MRRAPAFASRARRTFGRERHLQMRHVVDLMCQPGYLISGAAIPVGPMPGIGRRVVLAMGIMCPGISLPCGGMAVLLAAITLSSSIANIVAMGRQKAHACRARQARRAGANGPGCTVSTPMR